MGQPKYYIQTKKFILKSIDIIQQKHKPRRYFIFLSLYNSQNFFTSGGPFLAWTLFKWASTQRANKKVRNILKVQIMFEQLIKHWFMHDWHENITYYRWHCTMLCMGIQTKIFWHWFFNFNVTFSMYIMTISS